MTIFTGLDELIALMAPLILMAVGVALGTLCLLFLLTAFIDLFSDGS